MNKTLPTFLMNVPESFDTKVRNNFSMMEYSDEEIVVNKQYAYEEMYDIYSCLSEHGFVYLLPTPKDCELQDLVFVANNGIVLPQFDPPVFIAPKFKAENRIGEEKVSIPFFEQMGYDIDEAPYHFEGEADLKYLRDNIYIGGYGLRSDIKTYEWLEEKYGLKIIKVKMKHEELYHLDCSIFPVKKDKVIVATDVYEKEEIAEIEKYAEVIPITFDLAYAGLANSVVVKNTILTGVSADIKCPNEIKKYKEDEIKKQKALNKIAKDLGMKVEYFDLYEFMKGGAMLSCMVMNINYLDKM